jgi:hypothetical protein
MCDCTGNERYISIEKMFEYEHSSKYTLSTETRGLLVKEIEEDEFHLSPIPGKISFNNVESILLKHHGSGLQEIENEFVKISVTPELIHEMFSEIADFISTEPKLPGNNKNYISSTVPHLSYDYSREKITDSILKLSDKSELCELALYVYRNMEKIDWLPFIKAAMERNPVCHAEMTGKSIQEVYEKLSIMSGDSVYDSKRLALPDEVWNFKHGDGIEKALQLANFIIMSDKSSIVSIDIDNGKVHLKHNGIDYPFNSKKSFKKSIKISGTEYIIN